MFGHGPRNCIGIKFAQMELKTVLIEIFRRFEVKTTEQTVKKLDFIEGVIGILTHKVDLVFKKRNFEWFRSILNKIRMNFILILVFLI